MSPILLEVSSGLNVLFLSNACSVGTISAKLKTQRKQLDCLTHISLYFMVLPYIQKLTVLQNRKQPIEINVIVLYVSGY